MSNQSKPQTSSQPADRAATGTGRKAGSILAALFALAAVSTTAEAQLQLCNKADETVSIAVGYERDGLFVSEGWYIANPGACVTAVGGPLRTRYYYVHASTQSNRTWGEDYSVCVRAERFTHAGLDCSPGYYRRTFFRIDVGSQTSWTHSLTSGGAPRAAGGSGSGAGTGGSSMRSGIAGLTVRWRPSAVEGLVLMINNERLFDVETVLRCYTTGGDWKDIPVFVPAKGVAEVGFLQGWPGNFLPGERCVAYYGSERIWEVVVPRG